jgi:hypothetical protein
VLIWKQWGLNHHRLLAPPTEEEEEGEEEEEEEEGFPLTSPCHGGKGSSSMPPCTWHAGLCCGASASGGSTYGYLPKLEEDGDGEECSARPSQWMAGT